MNCHFMTSNQNIGVVSFGLHPLFMDNCLSDHVLHIGSEESWNPVPLVNCLQN